MSKKLGRNELCWCGSGKKYKHCHLRRETQPEVTRHELVDTWRTAYKVEECLHPEAPTNCHGNIVKAHTIQKTGGLSKIARKGHVYTPSLVQSGNDLRLEMRLEGVNKASTFTGFCSYHDDSVFAPIEKYALQVTKEHALLLAFRAISRELFAKRRASEMMRYAKTLDRGKEPFEQYAIQDFVSLYESGTHEGLIDLEQCKKEIDSALISKDYSNVNYYAVELDRTPDIMCSGAFFPEFDFHGNSATDLRAKFRTQSRIVPLTFSIMATAHGGVAFITWVGQAVENERFVGSLNLLSDTELPHALVRLAFEHLENIFIGPLWWDSLSKVVTESLMGRFQASLEATSERDSKCLMDDGLHLVKWKVLKRHSSGSVT